MILLFKILLAHLMGDFLLQPTSWVKNKEKRKIKSKFLYFHFLVHTLLLMVLVFRIEFIPYAILLGVIHILIDLLKLYLQSEVTKRIWFLIDQILHIFSILFLIILYDNIIINNYSLVPQFWPILTALLFLTVPASITIKNLISIWTPNTNDTKQDLENAGTYIGILERLFIFLFILIGQFSAIGFLLAAKSIFRFGDLTKSKDRKLTEYVLIGTLLSFGIAIVTGLATKYILGFLS
ncbi:DUF3307 domain-containing protein [Flavobacterium ardleyense]|uniref:DUF3307 domain-containing protein n=1 Tax=Flavobacterium ardleyense TaxID=2038737 RepID=UPI00298C1B72|nr:DUF3307 domain-containing protein [Flavobacterium ardleyense]